MSPHPDPIPIHPLLAYSPIVFSQDKVQALASAEMEWGNFGDKPTDGQRSGFNLPLQSQYPKVINPLCKAKSLTYPQTEDLDNPVKIHNFQPRPGQPSMVKWSHTEGVFWDLSTKFFEWSVQNIAAMFCLDWQQKNMVKAFHWKVPFSSNIFKSVTHCWQWCFRYNIQKFDTSC